MLKKDSQNKCWKMEIGKFRERITIQTATNTTNANTGEIETAWADSVTVFALKEVLTGSEKESKDIVTAIDKTNFLVRYGHDVDNSTNFRIKYNSKYYDIESVEEVEFRTISRLRCVQRSNITS